MKKIFSCIQLFVLFGALVVSAIGQNRNDYDLLLKGGHVVDGKNNISAIRDVAIKDGKIAAVAENIAPSRAYKTVDMSGLYVTPGLVDIHFHCYGGLPGEESSMFSAVPDLLTFKLGVTTVAEAGTSGWRNFPDFKQRVIDRSKTRILVFLNIVGNGGGNSKQEQDLDDMDAKATADLALRYKDIIIGIKTRDYTGPEWTPFDRAREAATLANIVWMCDFGVLRPERPIKVLMESKLRPGDIYTHTYAGLRGEMDDANQPIQALWEARKRGVWFDVGPGGGSFLFRSAVNFLKAGFVPDSISSDRDAGGWSVGQINTDLLNAMSRFLNMGMSLDSVINCVTWNPAREIKRPDLGNLSVGSPADVAVLHVEKGNFGFVDMYGARLKGTQRVACDLTVRDGKVVFDLNGITREDWDKLGNYRTRLGDRVWDGIYPAGRGSTGTGKGK
jgi:dihydroorotase